MRRERPLPLDVDQRGALDDDAPAARLLVVLAKVPRLGDQDLVRRAPVAGLDVVTVPGAVLDELRKLLVAAAPELLGHEAVDVAPLVHVPRLQVLALAVVDHDALGVDPLDAGFAVLLADFQDARAVDAGVPEALGELRVDAGLVEHPADELLEVLSLRALLVVALFGEERRLGLVLGRNLRRDRADHVADDVERQAGGGSKPPGCPAPEAVRRRVAVERLVQHVGELAVLLVLPDVPHDGEHALVLLPVGLEPPARISSGGDALAHAARLPRRNGVGSAPLLCSSVSRSRSSASSGDSGESGCAVDTGRAMGSPRVNATSPTRADVAPLRRIHAQSSSSAARSATPNQ